MAIPRLLALPSVGHARRFVSKGLRTPIVIHQHRVRNVQKESLQQVVSTLKGRRSADPALRGPMLHGDQLRQTVSRVQRGALTTTTTSGLHARSVVGPSRQTTRIQVASNATQCANCGAGTFDGDQNPSIMANVGGKANPTHDPQRKCMHQCDPAGGPIWKECLFVQSVQGTYRGPAILMGAFLAMHHKALWRVALHTRAARILCSSRLPRVVATRRN